MSHTGYDKKIEPLCPVAVKMGQSAVHAPQHDNTWGAVTCDACGEGFFIGPHRIYGSRIGKEECERRLRALLSEDHRLSRPHANSYDIPD